MLVKQIFDLAIQLGIKNDLRGEKKVLANLKRIKEKFDKLPSEKKKLFDSDRLVNPYMDSQILFDSKKPVKKVMAGIDIDTAEMLLAEELDDIDCVIAHHPTGKGLTMLHDVMHLQVEVLADLGVPIAIAQGLFRVRIDEVSRGVNPSNHFKTPMAAELLKISLMNVHTPCDNLVANFLKQKLGKKKYEYVGEVMEVIKSIPEYAHAAKQGVGPRLFTGSEDNYCGKIALTEITGGTEGSAKVYEQLANAGYGTVIGMHVSEAHKKEAEKNHINVIIAGHISSDSIGMNLFLDQLEKKGIKVVPCSGLIRVRR